MKISLVSLFYTSLFDLTLMLVSHMVYVLPCAMVLTLPISANLSRVIVQVYHI